MVGSIRSMSREKPELPQLAEHLEIIIRYPTGVEPEIQIELSSEIDYGSTEEVLIGYLGSVAVDDRSRVIIFL